MCKRKITNFRKHIVTIMSKYLKTMYRTIARGTPSWKIRPWNNPRLKLGIDHTWSIIPDLLSKWINTSIIDNIQYLLGVINCNKVFIQVCPGADGNWAKTVFFMRNTVTGTIFDIVCECSYVIYVQHVKVLQTIGEDSQEIHYYICI